MGFWEFLLWVSVAYFIYKVLTAGTIPDIEKFQRGLHKALKDFVNPPLDQIIEALDEGDIKKARQLTVKFRADTNDYNKAIKK